MTDEPDGDRSDDPSDAASEEDPFIYPLADDSEEDSDAAESSTDADGAASGTEAASAGDDASTPGAEGASTDGVSSSAGDDDATTGGDASRGGTGSSSARSSTSDTGSSTSGGGPSASSRGASSTGSGGASKRTGRSTARSGSTSGDSSGRTASSNAASPSADVGAHATDRRSHASEGGRTRPSRGGSAGAGSAGQARSTGGAHGRPRGRGSPTESGPSGVGGWLRWFWTTDEGPVLYVRDVVTSVVAVLVVGLVLFAISGIWPPMVAVESGSMEPNMQVGDLVFIVDNERYTPEGAQEYEGQSTGVVPADRATETGRSKFGGPGDVVVFRPNGNEATTPVIHRAMLWVQEGENWYDRADPEAVGTANDCDQLNNCPAPHAGFITRGDANPRYDQQTTLSAPVRPEWIVGTAELRIPYLGHIRLAFSGQIAPALDAGFDATAAGERRTSRSAPAAATHPTTRSPGTPKGPGTRGAYGAPGGVA